MPRKPAPEDRVLLITLTLEAAVQAENWSEVNQLLNARGEALAEMHGVSAQRQAEIAAADERMLSMLRKRLTLVRSDLRNLSAALRIASGYTPDQGSSMSLAS